MLNLVEHENVLSPRTSVSFVLFPAIVRKIKLQEAFYFKHNVSAIICISMIS